MVVACSEENDSKIAHAIQEDIRRQAEESRRREERDQVLPGSVCGFLWGAAGWGRLTGCLGLPLVVCAQDDAGCTDVPGLFPKLSIHAKHCL